MSSFDGIQRGSAPRPRPMPPPPARPRSGAGRATPRNAGFAVGIIVLLTIFAILRPNSEASSRLEPPAPAPLAEASANRLPPQLAEPPKGTGETNPDALVILDNPTDSSKAQPEEASELSQTIELSELEDQTASNETKTAAAPDEVTTDFTIRILNGGGKSGAAAALKAELGKQSFTVSSIGNAHQTYAVTTVYYQAGKRAQAELLAKTLGEPAVTLEENAIARPADVLVVIGTDRS